MTDNEIKKALECCSRYGNCEGCPYADDECITAEGESILMKETLDLINHQKAEIERLKARNNELNKLNKTVAIVTVKEFAKRLHEELYAIPTIYNSHFGRMVDNLIDVRGNVIYMDDALPTSTDYPYTACMEGYEEIKQKIKEAVGDDNA